MHLDVILVLYTKNIHSGGSAISDFTFPERSYIVNHASFSLFFFFFSSSAQVHQLSPHRDQHFSSKLGSYPTGGAAGSQPGVGGVRPASA